MADVRSTVPWSVIFTGTGGYNSSTFRAFPSTVVRAGGTQYLIDCGDGTVGQLRHFDCSLDFGTVLLTGHTSEELAGLLALGELAKRRSPSSRLRVYGPPGTRRAMAAIASVVDDLDGVFDVTEPEAGVVIADASPSQTYVEPVPLGGHGRVVRYGYLFYEAPLPGRVNVERAELKGIKGPEFALLQSGETVRGVRPSDVIGSPRPGRRLVVAGKGRPSEVLSHALQGADVAVMSAPFMDDRLEVAIATGSMTGWEAAELAQAGGTKMLFLRQLGPYCRDFIYRAEAAQFHPHVFTPLDGSRVEIPLPDRGKPTFKRE